MDEQVLFRPELYFGLLSHDAADGQRDVRHRKETVDRVKSKCQGSGSNRQNSGDRRQKTNAEKMQRGKIRDTEADGKVSPLVTSGFIPDGYSVGPVPRTGRQYSFHNVLLGEQALQVSPPINGDAVEKARSCHCEERFMQRSNL